MFQEEVGTVWRQGMLAVPYRYPTRELLTLQASEDKRRTPPLLDYLSTEGSLQHTSCTTLQHDRKPTPDFSRNNKLSNLTACNNGVFKQASILMAPALSGTLF